MVVFLQVGLCHAGMDNLEYHCPASIVASQKLESAASAMNWLANNTEKTHFYSRTTVSFMSESGLMQLHPFPVEETNDTSNEIYDLSFERKQGVKIHVACWYLGTTVQVSQIIPLEYNYCEIFYEKKAGKEIEKAVVCAKSSTKLKLP